MFSIGQRTAVEGAFTLAGHAGPLMTAPVARGDERAFLLTADDLQSLRDVRILEQVLQQILGCKVFVVERTPAWGTPTLFE